MWSSCCRLRSASTPLSVHFACTPKDAPWARACWACRLRAEASISRPRAWWVNAAISPRRPMPTSQTTRDGGAADDPGYDRAGRCGQRHAARHHGLRKCDGASHGCRNRRGRDIPGPPDARTATIVGCDVQGELQLAAITAVLPLRHIMLVDIDHAPAE